MKTKQQSGLFAAAAVGLALALSAACSTDSPTAPVQEPIPPSGGTASAAWSIRVSADPDELTVGSTVPATVTVRVRRADNNQPPPNGTTLVLSTSLGEFVSAGSGIQSAVLATAAGFGSVLLFPGPTIGTAFVTARLEGSVGQAALPIVDVIEPVVASFAFENSNSNLSVQFQNTSEGNPTEFLWEFGDGRRSREENPSHLYAAPGDYVVKLTASKPGSTDSTSRIVSVTHDPELEIEASFEATVDGLTVVFRDTSTGNPTRWSWNFGDGGTSSAQNPTHVYAAEGIYVVTLRASNSASSGVTSQTISTTEELFITDISPAQGTSAGGTTVTISGTGFVEPLRVFFGGVLAETISVTGRTTITVKTPPGVVATVVCEVGGSPGTRAVDTAVSVTVELSSGTSQTVSGGFTYVPPDKSCNT